MEDIRSDRRLLILIRTCNNINRELARLKARAVRGSACDLTRIAAVVDVQHLMALAVHASRCRHADRNRAVRLDLIAVFIPECNVDRDGIDNFPVLADRVLYAVIGKNT